MRVRVCACVLVSLALAGCRDRERSHGGDDPLVGTTATTPEDSDVVVDTAATTGVPPAVGYHALWVHNDDIACALSSSGSVRCWGDGAAALPDAVRSGQWQSVAVFDGVRDPAWGCGLREDGEVECWGCGGAGYGTWCDAPTGSWDQLYATDELGFCVSAEGKPFTCWGFRALVNEAPPVTPTGIDLPCGVDAAGAPLCWAVPADVRPAMTLAGPFRAMRIDLANFWCGVTPDDRLLCEDLREDAPGIDILGLPPDPPPSVLDVDLRHGALCAILPDRTLECAVDPVLDMPELLLVPEGTYSEVQIGGSAACAIAEEDGSVSCWGDPSSSLLRGVPE